MHILNWSDHSVSFKEQMSTHLSFYNTYRLEEQLVQTASEEQTSQLDEQLPQVFNTSL